MATTKIVKNKNIIILDGVTNIGEYTYNVIADLLQASNNPIVQINSGVRDSASQASAMYNNLKGNTGEQVYENVVSQKGLYGPNGDRVIDVFIEQYKEGKSEIAIRKAMEDKINELGPRSISKHCSDPSQLQVVDIQTTKLKHPEAFLKAVREEIGKFNKNKTGKVSKVIDERKLKVSKNVFHIEIPQSQNKSDQGDSPTSTPSSSPKEFYTSWDDSVEKYIHPDTAIETSLDVMVENPNFIGYDIDPQELRDFTYRGQSNNYWLYRTLDRSQKKLYGKNDGRYDENIKYPVTPGSIIFISHDKITVGEKKSKKKEEENKSVSSVDTDSNTRVNKDQEPTDSDSIISPYFSNITISKDQSPNLYPYILRKLSLDPGYTPASKQRGKQSKDIYPQFSCKIWSRLLSQKEDSDGFINITPDVIRCSVSSRIEGGQFLIEVQPIVGKLDGVGEDETVTNENQWGSVGTNLKTKSKESISLNNSNRTVTTGNLTEYRRNNLLYNMIFQQNDMVWIKFERLLIENISQLETETGSNLVEGGGDIEQKTDPFGEWHDMIGLIDAVETSYDSNNNISITIRGRDLLKVLQDDNAYINPYSINHSESSFGGDVLSNGRLNGQFLDKITKIPRTIRQQIEFLFHRVASIGYVPNDVFDKIQNKTEITVSEAKDEPEYKIVKGAWQCIKLFIDKNIESIKIADTSINRPQGSILDIINKTCQEPFVEFFGDTFGDKFYLIVRTPPFEQSVIVDIVDEIVEKQEDSGAINTDNGGSLSEFNNSQEKEKQKRSEIRREKEIEYLQQKDQNTVSQYSIMSREEQDNAIGFENSSQLQEVEISSKTFPAIINISESDINSETLRFSNQAYSWYEVETQGLFSRQKLGGRLPAVYFDDIAQIFGNRKLSVITNYNNYKFIKSNKQEDYIKSFEQQAGDLLGYLIETNIYVPFTREGSITLSNTDRRIKKGNWIFYRPTREVFYVTGVNHEISISNTINSTSIIEVERGMIIDYIKGSTEPIRQEDGSVEEKKVSYFNIVDIPKIKQDISSAILGPEGEGSSARSSIDPKKRMSLNKDILNFFLERRQFKQYE